MKDLTIPEKLRVIGEKTGWNDTRICEELNKRGNVIFKSSFSLVVNDKRKASFKQEFYIKRLYTAIMRRKK